MLIDIATWAGAVLGIAVLGAMALGSVAIDFDTGRRRLRRRTSDKSPQRT